MPLLWQQNQLENPQEWRSLTRHLMDVVKPAIDFFQGKSGAFIKFSKLHAGGGERCKGVDYLKSKGILVRLMHPPENSFRMSLRNARDGCSSDIFIFWTNGLGEYFF